MVVRELTGGVTYESERIGRVAFEFAGQRRNEVTSSDERNVIKSGVLWDEVITALRAREYADAGVIERSGRNLWMFPAKPRNCPRARRAGRHPVPTDLARLDHPAPRRAGIEPTARATMKPG